MLSLQNQQLLSFLFNNILQISCDCNKVRQRNQRHPDKKEGTKLFIHGMTTCVENFMESTKKLLEIVGELGKVSG
jgi:hypothetical protein